VRPRVLALQTIGPPDELPVNERRLSGSIAAWREDVQIILGLVMWPFVIIYHVVWTRYVK